MKRAMMNSILPYVDYKIDLVFNFKSFYFQISDVFRAYLLTAVTKKSNDE